MKKLLFITCAFFLASFTVKSQTIDSVSVTAPIICYGDLATVTAFVSQTSPSTPLQYRNYRFVNAGLLFQEGVSSVTTGVNQPFTGIIAGDKRMVIVDSLAFANATSGMTLFQQSAFVLSNTHPSILDFQEYTVFGVPELTATTTQIAFNLCHGDCDASEQIIVSGGTPPYLIDIGGVPSVMSNIDTIFSNLCADNYNLTVTDLNGCATSPAQISINIAEPSELEPNGSITSDYNGQNISCYGASDGEITASVNGGTSPYTYSIDGVTFTSNSIFSGLSAGSYTITYQDANGCDTTETFILQDPPDLSGAISITQSVSCNAACDGEIQFIVDNVFTGTSPYTYSIDAGLTFQNSNTFSGLCGSTNHSIIVRDVNGCEFTASVFLTEPTAISFSTSSSNFNGYGVTCNGSTDGQIIIFSPTGGTPNYDYSIDGGATYSSTMIHNNLAAGTYQVIVRDDNGCTNDTTIIITEPLPFTINANTTSNYNGSNVSCPNICDGSMIVVPQNGVVPIIYDVNTFASQTSNTWTGLCGGLSFGSYNIDATDANGCTTSTSIILTEPQPFIYSVDSVKETCNLSNGQASINVTQGGTPSYAYLWDDPAAQITATATGLTTGLYEVRVTDANGCTFTETVFVDEADITLSFDSVPPCNFANDGSATVNPDGTPPYQITWFNGDTSNTITGLSPGYYSVTVVDGTGCLVTDSVEIPASSNVDIVLDNTNSTVSVACFGYPSSGVTVIASGGTGPNTYLYYIPNTFPTPQASNVFSGLYAGTYPIYATDANGCSDSVLVTITEPDQLNFTTDFTDVSCYSGNDGTVFIDTVYGGTPPYTYSWSNGVSTAVNSNLIADVYVVTVTDINGCSSNPLSDTVIVNEPSQLQSSITVLSHSDCSGAQTLANGEVLVTLSGGTPGYSYLWSTGSTSSSINFLLPGIYTVEATDANGCIINDTVEVLQGENPDLNVIIQNVSCFGANDGMMFTSATGGQTPYQFSSDGGNSFVPSGTPFGPSGQATYFITVVDALGCTDSDSVFVVEPDLLEIVNINILNVSCYDSADGQLTVQHIGGTTPYNYLWGDPASQVTQTAIDLSPGSYGVIVSDTNGCADTSWMAMITQPDSLYITSLTHTPVLCNGGSDGTASVIADGGTPNYSYNWSSSGTASIEQGLSTGTYSVTISDLNGCNRTGTIFVSEPNALSTSFIKDSVTCVGGSDGWATTLVNGGVSPYTYLWDNGSVSNTSNNLPAGYHTVIVTDTNGCILIDSVNILQPSQSITIDSLIVSEITCHDANNASITVLATGGDLPYMYSSTNGFNMQSNIGFISLSANTYIIYVQDDRGCFDRDTIEITNPDSLYIDTTIFSNVQCFGYCNGSIQSITAFGGNPFTDLNGNLYYEYSVNGGLQQTNMASFNSYCPGSYTVEVFDANNCAAQDIIIIDEPVEMNVTISTSLWNGFQIRCSGDSSGTASISVSGGVAPYIVTCLDANNDTVVSSNSLSINGLEAGLYTFIVQDSYGCFYEEQITYYEPTPITHTFIPTHVSCNGWSNGSLVDVVSGGVGTATTYTYAWNTGDSTYSLTNIPTGMYTMTVVDENNCISVDSYTINSSAALSISIDNIITTEITCYDYCDGVIALNVSGGIPNINSNGSPVYNFSWDDILQQNTQNAIGLCVDNGTNTTSYSCIVTDAQGCTETITYNLTQPEDLVVNAIVTSDVNCYGDSDGKLSANTTGGNGGNTYIWNNWTTWSPNPSNTNLPSADYVVVVKDSKGCMDTAEIFLSEPTELEVSIEETDVTCYGLNDGEIIATASGGTPFNPILNTYNYSWNPGGQTTQTAVDLTPGIYNVTVTDQNGCTITSASVYITEPANPLTLDVDSTDETCNENDGIATAFVSGGTQPYSYNWTNGSLINPISNLEPGVYSVIVTDINGCEVTGSTEVVGVRNIFLPGNRDEIDTNICLGSSVFIDIEEKPGLSYNWVPGGNNPDIVLSPNSIGLHSYILYISDPSCVTPYDVTVDIFVSQIEANFSADPTDISFSTYPIVSPDKAINHLSLVTGETVEISANNNSGINHQWNWEQQQNSLAFTDYYIIQQPENNQWYHLELDSAGCKGYDSVYVGVSVIAYDAITPNNDGMNDEWTILGIYSNRYEDAVISIFNRWGELVYQTSGGASFEPWDGTSEGEELPVGTYYYVIDLNNSEDPQSGPITIVR